MDSRRDYGGPTYVQPLFRRLQIPFHLMSYPLCVTALRKNYAAHNYCADIEILTS